MHTSRQCILKAWILGILMLLPAMAHAFDFSVGGIYYNITSAEQQTVEVTTRSVYYSSYTEKVSIPSEVQYNDKTFSVTTIGNSAFNYCDKLTSITIPNSVTSIGNDAFIGCSGLTSITIPNSVTSIGNNAFSNCSGLTSLTIPNSVTSIGDYAFNYCSALTSLTIPNSVTSIGDYAFSACSGLTSLTIPNSVTSIGDGAFSNCSGLTSLTIPTSVTSISNYAFSDCRGLTSLTIPNSVTSIGEGAFYGCSGITSLTIATTVTSIGEEAFKDCRGLTSLTIPNSVKSIRRSAFSGCSGLTSLTIPTSVTSIGNYAFSDCRGLTSLTIPNSVTSIGDSAFSGCSGLTSVPIPNSVTSIGSYAFSGCSGLTSVTIPNSVTSIDSFMFYNCTGLTSVIIPNSVTSIRYMAFGKCPNIKTIYSDIVDPVKCYATADAFKGDIIPFNYDAVTLTVPYGTAEKYRATAPWSNFTNIVERVPEGPLATFAVADATMRMGETLTIPVSMNNQVDIISFQCDIHLPAGFEVVKNADGEPVVKLGTRKKSSHTIDANVLQDGVLRVACYSIKNASFSGTEGELFTIDIQPVSASTGVHEVTIDNIVAAKSDLKGVNIAAAKCSINLRKALMPGDVNDDDEVNVSDAIATVGYILGNAPENYLLENADLNGDGIINILDVSEIINLILNASQTSQAPEVVKAPMLAEANTTEAEALYVENFEIKSGEEKLLPIKLKANREYTGFQTDIYLPEGLEVVTITEDDTTSPDVQLNEECNSGTHIISSAMQTDGALRVLSMSMKNKMFKESTDKTLFTIRVRVKPEFTSSVTVPVHFRKTLFDSGKVKSNFADSSSEVGINNTTTGIADVINGENAKQYFNLQGMPVQNPVKGMIYILKTATTTKKVVY